MGFVDWGYIWAAVQHYYPNADFWELTAAQIDILLMHIKHVRPKGL